MKRLLKHLPLFAPILLVGSILTICSLATFNHTSEAITGSSTQKGCNTSCTSHGQAPAINSLKDEKEDELEPTPPADAWWVRMQQLSLLYSLPVALGFLLIHSKRHQYLSAQLRI